MPVTNVRSQWVAGNLEFVKATDADAKVGGIPAISGSTTCAADVLAIPITHRYVAKTTGADAEALTLANGVAGQVLIIHLTTDGGGTGTLTPTTCTGFVSVAFADAGDQLNLEWVDDTIGWVITNASGVAAPPAISLS